MSEQPAASIDCGRTTVRAADRPADHRPSPRRPRCAAGRSRLGSDAAGAGAVAGAAGALTARETLMRRDPRGNPVTTASAAALDASERALWRMMSFYGTPIDDLDAAIAADPAWRLPRLMKAGFLLSLTEPALAGDAAALLARDGRRSRPHRRPRACPSRARCSASPPATGSARATSGAQSSAAHPRDAIALQWAHLFDFYRGDSTQLRDRAGAASRRGPTTIRSIPTCSRCTRSVSRNPGSTKPPKPPAGARSPATRACRGRSTRSRTSWRCRDATPKARAGSMRCGSNGAFAPAPATTRT